MTKYLGHNYKLDGSLDHGVMKYAQVDGIYEMALLLVTEHSAKKYLYQ